MPTEQDIIHKTIIPYLADLGYSMDMMEFDKSISVRTGSQSCTIRPDILIHDNGLNLMVLEAKRDSVELDTSHIEQAISYARLLNPIPPVSVISNGKNFLAFDSLTKQQIAKVPSYEDIRSISNQESTNDNQYIRSKAISYVANYDDIETLKGVLKKCHNVLYGDITDPISAFDEMNKLILIKIYAEKHNNEDEIFGNNFSLDTLNSFFTIAISEMADIYDKNEKINVTSADVLRKVFSYIRPITFSEIDHDILGVAYESFLPSFFRGEGLAQYFTPDAIKNFMLDISMDTLSNQTIIDPAFGSGGFLVFYFKRFMEEKIRCNLSKSEIAKERKLLAKRIYGVDKDPRLAMLAKMNMQLHGDGKANLHRGDSLVKSQFPLSEKLGSYDLVITNPPFGKKIEPDVYQHWDFSKIKGLAEDKKKSEIYFLEICIDLAKSGHGGG